MNFNKLYNLILLSIITLNREYRKKLIDNSKWDPSEKNQILVFLNNLNNNKLADFLAQYFASQLLYQWPDPKIEKVKDILEVNPSIDTQNFKGSLELFIQKYTALNLTKIKLRKAKVASLQNKYLDTIPLFYDKHTYSYGVVVYRVKNFKEGMVAVRNIIDIKWGKDANPWCLAARQDGDLKNAFTMWNNYDAYPKQIAFQYGKLVAFRANCEGEDDMWWDRNDNPTNELRTLDDHELDIPVPEWTESLLKEFDDRSQEIFLDKNNLVYNLKTDSYDASGWEVKVTDKDLVNGKFPIKFGVLQSSFICACTNLTSLEGGPVIVTRNYKIHCPKLTSLKGMPTEVGGDLVLNLCNSLVNLLGCCRRVEGMMLINECKNLQSFKGGPRAVCKDFVVQMCPKLKSGESIPRFIGHRIVTYHLPQLFMLSDDYIEAKEKEKERLEEQFVLQYNLKFNNLTGRWDCDDGISIRNHLYWFINEEGTFIVPLGEIKGSFTVSQFNQLTSLKNGPTKVGGSFEIVGCHYLTSLLGCPKEVGVYFRLVNNSRLTSLNGITQHIGNRLIIANNTSLKDSSDLPTDINLLCVNERNLPKEFFQNDAYIALAKAGKVMKTDD